MIKFTDKWLDLENYMELSNPNEERQLLHALCGLWILNLNYRLEFIT